jgi:23S rRNA pseudouridine2457 synthase
MAKLIIFNKPFEVLSQFSDRERPQKPRSTLADYLSAPGFRPAGRLDFDSEGLLILTDNGVIQQKIAHPRHGHWKTYWVQVEGEIDTTACNVLSDGLILKDGPTRPCRARMLPAPALWERTPPIRQRKSVPDSWVELSITEGRNRQVRRMTAAAGYPTLRLVRVAVGSWTLGNLGPGEYCWVDADL